jgi:archaeosine synthase
VDRELLYIISKKRVLRGELPRELCFYSPLEVYEALSSNDGYVVKWLQFVSESYIPPPTKTILLLYPCSAVKPYNLSRSYKALYSTLEKLPEVVRKSIHVVTISEPFGLVPEEFYEKWSKWYDCPGLFEWWCNKYGVAYDKELASKCINILAIHIARFLVRTRDQYAKRIAFVRTYTSSLKPSDSTHRKIMELATSISGVQVELHPSKDIVEKIVKDKGRSAWDFYGVSHPLAQEYLARLLTKVANDREFPAQYKQK